MSDSHAESLDPTVLGEKVGDDRRPAADYPPEEPLGVEDPSIVEDGIIARDDVASRDEREQPETDETATRQDRERVTDGLIDTNVSPDGNDHEERLLADSGDRDTGPEAGALHVEND
ncbi:hypothetical protein [Ilumatobacter nonamiensis]|uniref:hypothetical protein n=1 Tax=Ilumatobacter nonamiensis TaxID=467093 RepID=UPI0011D27DD5|nr:hypothetical protein [Ilumatobacter nonamiensis]